jgi:hypothetical protein
MRALFFPLFSSPPFLTALLSLVSDLHTKSICNYFSVFPHSSSPSLSNSSFYSALEKRARLSITAKRSLDDASKAAIFSATLLASSRERFAVMESGARFSSAEQKLELEREGDELWGNKEKYLQIDLVCRSETSERRAVRKGGELNRGKESALMWMFPEL